jgi:hypothetical protein
MVKAEQHLGTREQLVDPLAAATADQQRVMEGRAKNAVDAARKALDEAKATRWATLKGKLDLRTYRIALAEIVLAQALERQRTIEEIAKLTIKPVFINADRTLQSFTIEGPLPEGTQIPTMGKLPCATTIKITPLRGHGHPRGTKFNVMLDGKEVPEDLGNMLGIRYNPPVLKRSRNLIVHISPIIN